MRLCCSDYIWYYFYTRLRKGKVKNKNEVDVMSPCLRKVFLLSVGYSPVVPHW